MFITDNFLLSTPASQRLYHDYAANMPIFDYHCHLRPQEIYENKSFTNITAAWLGNDHYKWRAMRTAGIAEDFITGKGTDEEKFQAWARTLPLLMGNPLYHWTHLELARIFSWNKSVLNTSTAAEIFRHCNALLPTADLRPRSLLQNFQVRYLCTSDDPTDSLSYHKKLKAEGELPLVVLPTFRPDKARATSCPLQYKEWLSLLAQSAGLAIKTLDDFVKALQNRHDFFASLGCRLSDHAVVGPFGLDYTESEIKKIFEKLINGHSTVLEDRNKFGSFVLEQCALMDHKAGWTTQLHLGVLRDKNNRSLANLGPNSGHDALSDEPIAADLVRFLDKLNSAAALPQMILFSVNPHHYEVLTTVAGCFQQGPAGGKLQLGTAWWFNDSQEGMLRQMEVWAQMSVFGAFVGMTTDSRSFLSLPRHEYFRRLLCDFMGKKAEAGEIPLDFTWLGEMVKDICFRNAQRFFKVAS